MAALQWWQQGVIYQIYPRSFQDTDGDGVGDLRGITARLDYLAGLGVDAIWISPFYPSPMKDFGYDVADYTGVDPLFGTMEDFDELLREAHARGLRLILDFVPNHSSDEHPWFMESRTSTTNAKRNWYLWHKPLPGGDDWRPAWERLPNNWMSHFGGPAWQWDERTEQFYLHSFLKEQPDLNWRNTDVRAAMYGAMRFWLAKGVDGFRMDVLWLLVKDAEFRNNPPNPEYHGGMHDFASTLPVYNSNRPETHEIVAEMRGLMDSYGPTLPERVKPLAAESPMERQSARSHRVLIGEIYLPLPELVQYYGMPVERGPAEMPAPETQELNGANLPFNFHLIQTAWRAGAIAEIVGIYEQLLPPGGWPNYVLGNHDQPRLASRVGAKQARVAAMLLLTLRGTPTMYYGDELGMEDVPIAANQVRDPAEKNEPGKGRGRDPERSPMLWVNAPNAGFTTPEATPWLPIEADWPTKNAAVQRGDSKSMLTLYRRLLALRRQHDTLHAGAIADVAAEGDLLRYRRIASPDGDSTDFQVLLNLGTEIATTRSAPGTVVLTTLLDGVGARVDGEVTIEAGEGLLIALD
ncbi:MAG TPA: alpha-amylase family glycosyl hydrolase [Candidatus Aquilonibacter sp.]|nr:alpha-amylase family glycosyl hydrolase [Candidatus Aquilonibacter sp.]